VLSGIAYDGATSFSVLGTLWRSRPYQIRPQQK